MTIDGWGSPYGGAPNPPHNFSNKYYCANTYTTGGGGETQQDECSLGKIVGDVDHAYFSFYYRVDNDWTFNSGSDFNHKMMSISGGSAAYSSPYVYWEFRCDRINSSNVGIRDHGMASCAITSCDQVTSMLNSPRGNWVKLEYIFNFSSNGFQKAVADNRTVFHRSSCQVVSFSKNFSAKT